ncbi:MAG: hypothetical protein DSM106950_29255 [Stigonema ocellatum SAG 48.90 = DSM 106950]|nr:hypothetical protein [Stigonema ocellatum SAG 48.90 = DSM 106950]
MSNSNLSGIEIEILLFGKWRFDTSWEKITIQFKDDMTYEQTRIQTFHQTHHHRTEDKGDKGDKGEVLLIKLKKKFGIRILFLALGTQVPTTNCLSMHGFLMKHINKC